MISDILSDKFDFPVIANPGDTVTVTHTVTFDLTGETVTEQKSCFEITEEVTWTHSILFRLNGKLNHIVGDQDTLTWLEDQCDG
jgi:hypothetical protein